MVHDLSPVLLHLWGDVGIRWYGLSYIMAFVFAFFFFRWMSQRQNQNLSADQISDFVTAGALGVIIGGRLGYCFFYAPELIIQFRSSFPFWGVLAVHEGGMASHGGIIGLALATWWFAYRQRLQVPYLFDLIGGVGGMGIFFGRIANFINGELVGRIAPQGTPWTIKFPQDILMWPGSSPERLASLAETAATLPEMSREKYLQLLTDMEQNPGLRAQLYGVLEKIVHSIQNGNAATKSAIAGVLDARYPSQLIAAAFEGIFIFLILLAVSYKPRKPGVVGSLFLVLYASFRIFTERFRLPDAHLGFQALGLTRGQWLSIGMLLISVIIFISYARRGGLSIPGWGRSQNIKLARRSGSRL